RIVYNNSKLSDRSRWLHRRIENVEDAIKPTGKPRRASTRRVMTSTLWKAATNDKPMKRLAMPCGCLSVDGREPCDRHYRSSLLDVWPSTVIDKVRVSWYKEGEEQAYIEFDGKDSTYLNCSESSPSTYVYRHSSPPYERRFFINRNDSGCPNDEGWSVVLDKADPCDWGNSTEPYPIFLFSKLSTFVNWNNENDVGRADVLAITVKFVEELDIDQTCSPL
ncbi:hypothetical protein BaRGS_00036620, partial [Batillaria attramentaria]